ncbi:MAG: hypothetical protein HY094_03040 [Candidatus Melainabacteria bacterium]|nr:hypothetical protein [Candidatus Melainabacteria bacterium]
MSDLPTTMNNLKLKDKKNDTPLSWEQVKAEFLAGTSLRLLAEKYSVSFSTLKSRHARENWSKQRKKTEGKMQEEVITKVAKKKVKKAVDAVNVIDETIQQLTNELNNASSLSKESLARAIAELLKVRGTYTGETVQKNKTELETNIDIGTLYRMIIEKAEATPYKLDSGFIGLGGTGHNATNH